jgi:hypothetical protein
MSKRLQSRLLMFYGGTLVLVLVLFRFATAYGEQHLNAPPNLNGRYLSNESMPGCPASSRIVLLIQQSGIYLNGSLGLEEEKAASLQAAEPLEMVAEEKPSLKGRWEQEHIRMSGITSALTPCQPGSAGSTPAQASSEVSIQGKITPPDAKGTLTGQITVNGNAQPWQFTAQRQAAQPKSKDH